ncbi:zinc finger BED domain-containing protein 4-like [Colletes gigas]|uniref:zinc finger BED domain-containing protein 4-like n=1 Tax=Colletes gigas TaxID=935657 RepID=UPI001C9A9DDB|nr:zinc finger BED domain-containing protein 4-like [Colletes gigas]
MISGATSVLDPLHWATREMSSDPYVMISNIIPMVFCMEARLKKLKNLQSNVELFRKNLLNQFDEYYVNFENNLVYRFATFLDPRYKGTVFRLENSVEKIKDDLTKTYGNTRNKITSKKKMQTVDNAETEHLWEELQKVQKERVNTEYSSPSFTDDLDSYLNSEVIDRKLNPITW